MKNVKRPSSPSLVDRLDAINAVLTEQKAQDIVCLDVSPQSGGGFADRLFILTASSPRHARAIADAISKLCHDNAYDYLGVEGQQLGEWVLVDLNDIIVSIFLESTRALYKLEDMWGQLSREEKTHE
ncbi:MAG: ribosome silencing factor [Desulfovibrio sp.]|nr:ribosome silencing factor [Desulfovibrio sp.]